ncbi:MAG: hypothetical protein ABGX68_04255 [Methylococcales bacterium]
MQPIRDCALTSMSIENPKKQDCQQNISKQLIYNIKQIKDLGSLYFKNKNRIFIAIASVLTAFQHLVFVSGNI